MRKIILAMILCIGSILNAGITTEGVDIEVSFGTIRQASGEGGSMFNKPLGFDCLHENEITLVITNPDSGSDYHYIFDINEKECLEDDENRTEAVLTWQPFYSRVFEAGIKYDVVVTEQDIMSDDIYNATPFILTEEEIKKIRNNEGVIKDIGNSYFIGFQLGDNINEIINNKMLTQNINNIRKIKENYISIDSVTENHVLDIYKNLKERGISQELSLSLNTDLNANLKASLGDGLVYMNYVITGLKDIQKELRTNNSQDLKKYIQQTKYLMYAWTRPFELLATKNILNNTLLGEMSHLDNMLAKNNNTYTKYTTFINTLVYEYMSLYFRIHRLTPFTKKDTFDILNSNESESLSYSIIFDLPTSESSSKKLVEHPLSDDWYSMLRLYIELQNNFYKTKKQVTKIIDYLEVLPNTEIARAELTKELYSVDKLYRSLDQIVRYNIIDLPVLIYADIYKQKLNLQTSNVMLVPSDIPDMLDVDQHISNIKTVLFEGDDKEAMADIAVAYNKSCANMQKYTTNETVIQKTREVLRTFKEEFDADEWKEIIARAKLTQDWFNMLNKVKIENK